MILNKLFSVYAPLNQNVALTSRWHYDLEGHRTLEAFAGLEYDDCCVGLTTGRQYLKSELQESWLPHAVLPFNDLRTDRGIL